ncbi:hypothetical protein CKO28_02900 [Rhodovibrio sodomensis]|uniref:Lipoprotein n=1 Tax=Rhodovibrio sodomensis TaxID=1088 RepID=A0ABS1D9A3_9PROT|nr:hypothetical protein [Rhodovibrio sodomensis]MBK1666991.1 hypothetical protein [Rhodovibrio sodomensis]
MQNLLLSAAALALLTACADDRRPVIDPHDQVPFPGSNPVSHPNSAVSDWPLAQGDIAKPVARVTSPEIDPRCELLDAGSLKPAYLCEVAGNTYVLQ